VRYLGLPKGLQVPQARRDLEQGHMTEFWIFIGTLAVGLLWLVFLPPLIKIGSRSFDHAAGRLYGMTAEEVDKVRED
jgi:hypothetical protein